jgi:DnaJ-class molecular chaperone
MMAVTALASQDFYKRLGIDRSATAAEVKKAYFKLAKKYHPDANPDDKTAAKTFAEISEAYEVNGSGIVVQMRAFSCQSRVGTER